MVRGESHIDELQSLHSSHNIVRVVISKRLRWAKHVAKMKENRSVNLGVGGTALEWILGK
jgi:hypothetical protein